MGSPPQTTVTPAMIVAATDPTERRALIRSFTSEVFARAAVEDDARAAANLCRERDCANPPHCVQPLPEWCVECARRIELEFLVEDQEDDANE